VARRGADIQNDSGDCLKRSSLELLSVQKYLNKLSRKHKRFVILLADIVLLPLALWSAIALRFGELMPEIADLHWVLISAPLVSIPVFIQLGLYRAVIRYMEDKVALTVLLGVSLSTALLVAVHELLNIHDIPHSSYFIYWGIALIYIMGSRMLARAFFRHFENPTIKHKTVAIYGAGETGVKLAAALQAGQHFKVLAFIDDDSDLQGSEISGVRVFSPSSLGKLFEENGIESVLVGNPFGNTQKA